MANALNTSTLLGLLAAKLGGARLTPGPGGLVLAFGYRLRLPPAPAFTLGNVVVLRGGPDVLERRPALLVHEARHASQYAVLLGPLMLLPYLLAAAWSWARTGDPASRNVFERAAGLVDGGYRERPPRGRAH
ncbi:MAG TPA: hypothetical protein VK935_08850 [Actinomycetospora sp.]|nr:hypothetical protein [Actinomycetospora sp.]